MVDMKNNIPVKDEKPFLKQIKKEVKAVEDKDEPMVAVAIDGNGNRIFVRESKVEKFKQKNNL